VSIKKEASKKFHPGNVGRVCGMSRIALEEIPKKYNSQIGNWIYTLELSDGEIIQIASNYFEKYIK
jgi:hypothetical protein